jgi:hypothetical protein
MANEAGEARNLEPEMANGVEQKGVSHHRQHEDNKESNEAEEDSGSHNGEEDEDPNSDEESEEHNDNDGDEQDEGDTDSARSPLKVKYYIKSGATSLASRITGGTEDEKFAMPLLDDTLFRKKCVKADLWHNGSGHPRLTRIKKLTAFLRAGGLRAMPQHHIKIAIIDDGIDSSLDIFGSEFARISRGQSFTRASTNLKKSYYVSSGNHGTQLASLICSICPSTLLYIAKHEEQATGRGNSQINLDSVAKVGPPLHPPPLAASLEKHH